MKKLFFFIVGIILLTPTFVSCSNNEPEEFFEYNHLNHEIVYSLREANVLNLSVTAPYHSDVLNQHSETFYDFIEITEKEIKSTDYYILSQVYNDEALINDKNNSLLKKYRLDPDCFMPSILNNAKQRFSSESEYDLYVKSINNNVDKYANFHHGATVYGNMEFRQEECVSLEIKSTHDLFGRKAGDDLSDKFEMLLGNYYYGVNTADATKAFHMTGIIFDKGMNEIEFPLWATKSVKEYLSLKPTIFPFMVFHLKESPEELPIETDFTFEIGLSNGKVLKDTTHIILK